MSMNVVVRVALALGAGAAAGATSKPGKMKAKVNDETYKMFHKVLSAMARLRFEFTAVVVAVPSEEQCGLSEARLTTAPATPSVRVDLNSLCKFLPSDDDLSR